MLQSSTLNNYGTGPSLPIKEWKQFISVEAIKSSVRNSQNIAQIQVSEKIQRVEPPKLSDKSTKTRIGIWINQFIISEILSPIRED